MDIDIASLTLNGLVAIGTVNLVMLFKPDVDSRIRFILSFIAALAVSFIPPDLGTVLLTKAKEAIMVALAASGTYKLAQKVGGS